MRSRLLSVAAGALASTALVSCASTGTTAATPAAPATFSYAPGTSQYRLTSVTKAKQEAMGQSQDIESTTRQLFTVSVAPGMGDTLNVSTVLDSISVSSSMGMTPPGIDKLPGTKAVAKVARTGQVYTVVTAAPESVPNAAELTYEMTNILPKVRPVLTTGTTWTDTVPRKMTQGGIEIDRKTIATYTVVGDSTVNGQRALKISRSSKMTMSGSGAQGGQPMTLEGTSDGAGMMFVTPAGSFLGFTNEEKASIKVVLSANGMEIGITQNATTTVEKVK
jgi:hypothetical protein